MFCLTVQRSYMFLCLQYITSAIGVPPAFIFREENIRGLTRAEDTTVGAGCAPLVVPACVQMTTTFQLITNASMAERST